MSEPQPTATVDIAGDLIAKIDELRTSLHPDAPISRADMVDAVLRHKLLPSDEQQRNGIACVASNAESEARQQQKGR